MKKVKGIMAIAKQKLLLIVSMITTVTMNVHIISAGGISTSASTDAGKEWVKIVTTVLKELRTIAIPTGIVCGAAAALLYFFSKNQKVTEGAKDWGKRIVIGVIIICMLETIVNTLLGLTGQTTTYSNFIS